ncbi:hypothetical protein VOLCADRAFT_99393 [Volvox carteri f. nagariensis]|uniref:Uncharacterized protein n=1 Tax=Volvox carteri f. nagariensis TaxID=3068 RepID=D8UHQ0_VOLCA|nr:uncharacterized protein VOLCADRAFT_99393 [Volvox carteri f. nagariensis]XP_002959704.1 uncharacterized protein VOLCADRAFT_101218 [Volvox carteri f. nagariensis]EFJ39231.1 hypothetical protein VOLCADRAFT_101218 [Volvox carteri f. nagariensis]EFJ40717.1 hypothetical protein VOLCADRAFT_99393 [Volvox carteri f. nagariensis]|eukprot:XP_002958183.1 hypothetical protein VOLCADRAFT_99393 [Volvox carteri f. nagariensis]
MLTAEASIQWPETPTPQGQISPAAISRGSAPETIDSPVGSSGEFSDGDSTTRGNMDMEHIIDILVRQALRSDEIPSESASSGEWAADAWSTDSVTSSGTEEAWANVWPGDVSEYDNDSHSGPGPPISTPADPFRSFPETIPVLSSQELLLPRLLTEERISVTHNHAAAAQFDANMPAALAPEAWIMTDIWRRLIFACW